MTFFKTILILFGISWLVFQLARCQSEDVVIKNKNIEPSSPFLNLHDSVKYVGMNACKSCHNEIYTSFKRTGMGRSFNRATPQISDALFDKNHALVFDSTLNFYYYPYFKNDSLFFKEFRLEHQDTVYQRTEYISYIIGSGNHTNSHLVNFNGFLYQAPITFYTQKQKWDLAPGFENGFNSRFQRTINNECITCHNALPDFDFRSENRFKSLPLGIDCERCHGPGGLHVAEKLAGNIVDTDRKTDYTIVNPKKLNKDLQMNLCQRCHLQGLSILKEGKSFENFKPGMYLNEVMDIFLPVFESKDNNFLMASHVERLKLSACFKKSELTCITCHNPHISVLETPSAVFNQKCMQCHSEQKLSSQKQCSALPQDLHSIEQTNCVSCHMPKSGSIDIPHVSIHDHFISKPTQVSKQKLDPDEINSIQNLIELKCYTTDNPDNVLKAKAFMGFYEKFSKKSIYLDSAKYYIDKVNNDTLSFHELINYYYLKEDFNAIIHLAELIAFPIKNEWTIYRIGEAYYAKNNFIKALYYFQEATNVKPYQLDFLNKLAAAYFQLGSLQKSKLTYEKIIELQPRYKEALGNLGYIYGLENKAQKADYYISQSLQIDPDYETAILNKANLLLKNKQHSNAKKIILAFLKSHPESEKSKQLLKIIMQDDEKN